MQVSEGGGPVWGVSRGWYPTLSPFMYSWVVCLLHICRYVHSLCLQRARISGPLDYLTRWAGADVEMRTNGGSSCCTTAASSGNARLLRLLCREGGADASASGSEGRSPYWHAVQGGHHQAMEALRELTSPHVSHHNSQLPPQSEIRQSELHDCLEREASVCCCTSQAVKFRSLIEASSDHPGAGSFIVDGALTVSELDRLRGLWRALEVEKSRKRDNPHSHEHPGGSREEESGRESEGNGPVMGFADAEAAGESLKYGGVERRYFCDAEGWVRAMLSRALLRAQEAASRHSVGGSDKDVTRCHVSLGGHCSDGTKSERHRDEAAAACGGMMGAITNNSNDGGDGVLAGGALPYMRFLHYCAEGSSMAPHVDLSKRAPGDKLQVRAGRG